MPDAAAVDALRVEYRRVLLRLAARDLAHDLGIDDAAAELSDLAAASGITAVGVACVGSAPTARNNPARTAYAAGRVDPSVGSVNSRHCSG